MIRSPKSDSQAEAGDKVRELASQFQLWLGKSLENAALTPGDEGLLGLYTLLTMKSDEIMDLGAEETGRWVVGMSAFLGECIRTRFGGEYFRSGDQGFGLCLPNGREVYPIRWVQGQISNGKKASILVKYELLVSSLAGETGEDPDPAGPSDEPRNPNE